ncbi:MAG: hypothetical protein AB3N64_08630 [Puniceicoccaceae bacterium]
MPHKDPKKKAEYNRRYYQENRERLKEHARKYYHDNIDAQKIVRKQWREANKDKVKASNKAYQREQKQKIREYQQGRKNDPEVIAKRRNQKRRYYQQRIQRDPQWRVVRALRLRLWTALKQRKIDKSESSLELVGCEISALVRHIENLFQPGMSWENYGSKGWHIDHITPCAAFDLSDPAQQKKCFHYTNLQPLWARDNIVKGHSLPTSLSEAVVPPG